MKDRFCNHDCNNCETIRNRQLTVILNALYLSFGEGVYSIVQHFCPNLTCCADCNIDDFTHGENCELLKAAEDFSVDMKPFDPLPKPLSDIIREMREKSDYVYKHQSWPECSPIIDYNDVDDWADDIEKSMKKELEKAYLKGILEGQRYMGDMVRRAVDNTIQKEEVKAAEHEKPAD